MRYLREAYKILLGAALGILVVFPTYLAGEETTLWNIADVLSLGNADTGFGSSIQILEGMIPFLLFQIMYGVYLYRHYTTACVYYFTRYTRRGVWYLRESLGLLIRTVLYCLLYYLAAMGFLAATVGINTEAGDAWMACQAWLTTALYLFTMTMLMNLLAIQFGGTVGYFAGIILQVLLIASLGLCNEILALPPEEMANPGLEEALWRWNPISQLVGKWHTEISIQNEMAPLNYECSITILIVLICLVLWFGGVIVKKKEIIANDMEE